MAKDNSGSFPGHDEGTNAAPNAGFLNSPATHAPLTQAANGLDVKTSFGETGIPEGGGK